MKRRIKLLTSGLLCLCLCISLLCLLPAVAHADSEIGKVLATTSNVPVGTMPSYEITAATSTYGCYVSGYDWYDAYGNPFSDVFEDGVYRVEITLTANGGYYFSSGVAVYLNNSQADYVLSGDQLTLTLYRDYNAELWAPTVIKQPSNEFLEEGELVSFVSTALYVTGYNWKIESPDGAQSYNCADLPSLFPEVSTDPDGSQKMNIYNVPAYLDGWRVRCVFEGYGGSAASNYATINVKYDTPEPTAAPATPTPAATAAPTATPAPAGTAAPSSGVSDEYRYDDQRHWKEDQSGAHSHEAEHSMTWTTVTEATKKAPGTESGVCGVCGYTATRPLEYDAGGENNTARNIVLGIGGLVALVVAILIVDAIVSGARRRRRRRRRRR